MGLDTTYDFSFGSIPDLWRSVAKLQFETVTLMSRRAQAYLALPQLVSSCASTDALLAEQVKFWEAAQRHYLESFESALDVLPVAVIGSDSTSSARPRTRDYMIVTEATPTDAGRQQVQAAAAQVKPERLRKSA